MCKQQCECPVIDEDITASAHLTKGNNDVMLSVVEVTALDTDSLTYMAQMHIENEAQRLSSSVSYAFDTRLEAVKLFDSWVTQFTGKGYTYDRYED